MQGTYLLRHHRKEFLCDTSDLVLMKPGETAALENTSPEGPMRYYTLRLSEGLLQEVSDETVSFSEAFSFAPYAVAVVHSETKNYALLKNLISTLASAPAETDTSYPIHEIWGQELYRKCLCTSFLVHFVRACIGSDRVHKKNMKKELIIDEVFLYIRRHLTEDLSLAALEKEFFVSGAHLSRRFKEVTGGNIHTYIQKSRIDLSKQYLLQGYPVTQVYEKCGFTSYNHFFRVFKKECQVTPMEFARRL